MLMGLYVINGSQISVNQHTDNFIQAALINVESATE